MKGITKRKTHWAIILANSRQNSPKKRAVYLWSLLHRKTPHELVVYSIKFHGIKCKEFTKIRHWGRRGGPPTSNQQLLTFNHYKRVHYNTTQQQQQQQHNLTLRKVKKERRFFINLRVGEEKKKKKKKKKSSNSSILSFFLSYFLRSHQKSKIKIKLQTLLLQLGVVNLLPLYAWKAEEKREE